MKIGMGLGLGSSHIVLDEDPAPPRHCDFNFEVSQGDAVTRSEAENLYNNFLHMTFSRKVASGRTLKIGLPLPKLQLKVKCLVLFGNRVHASIKWN